MKRRIPAIIFALLLVLSLLPVSAAADNSIYVSVGGKAFTAFNQTISVGGGTATLTWENDNAVLTLQDAKITSFEKLGADDVSYYAAICFSGNARLDLRCRNSSIIAPAHGSDAVYEGIYSERPTFISGSLDIRNTDVGIECTMLYLHPDALDISGVGGPAILSTDLQVTGRGAIRLSSVGSTTVMAQGILIERAEDAPAVEVSLTADGRGGFEDAFAIRSRTFNAGRSVNVSVNADFSDYPGSEPLLCGAVYAKDLGFCNSDPDIGCTISGSVNVKSSKGVTIYGIYAENLRDNGKQIMTLSSRLSVSGDRTEAFGIYCGSVSMSGALTLLSEIKGAAGTDVPLALLSCNGGKLITDELYAATDCKSGLALLLPPDTEIRSSAGKSLRFHSPKNGSIRTLTSELPALPGPFTTVVNENGRIAGTILINDRSYPFRDLDLPSQQNFKPAILWAYKEGITAGVTATEFLPTSPCTRGQVVTFLWRAAGKPAPATANNPFVDVSSGSPYYKAILWAYENGITAGLDKTHFGPNNPCTRAQVVTFLWRYEGKPAPEATGSPFTDVQAGPFRKAILWGSENGIVSGYKDSTFRPSDTCTRAQIVSFLYRDLAGK